MNSILDHLPYEIPRQCQIDTLLMIEEHYDAYDCFVVRAPVGAGKSGIAAAIQSWQGGGAIITNNNLLRDQYLEEFDWMKTVKAQEDYWIEKYKMTEKEFRKRIYKYGPKGSEYEADRRCVKRVGTPIVVNYYSYIAHKLQRRLLVCDEAHQLLGTLQNMAAKKVWRHIHGYPKDATTLADVLDWIEGKGSVTGLLQKLKNEIKSLSPATTLCFTKDIYRGYEEDCLKLIPLNVSKESPIFWPSKTKKIVLMSATIGPQDIQAMGLGSRKILYIDVESPIPIGNRPIIFDPAGNMSQAHQREHMPDLATKILELAEQNDEKGFIHATYGMAMRLKGLLECNDRFMFHNHSNKKEVYEEFYDSDPLDGKIMVGSGMFEGIDLKYGTATWQVMTKCPYPSLADPAMRYLAEKEPDVYNWYVSRDTLQGSGRICRGPSDRGVTYLLDSAFKVWYNRTKEDFPRWFTDAVKGM